MILGAYCSYCGEKYQTTGDEYGHFCIQKTQAEAYRQQTQAIIDKLGGTFACGNCPKLLARLAAYEKAFGVLKDACEWYGKLKAPERTSGEYTAIEALAKAEEILNAKD